MERLRNKVMAEMEALQTEESQLSRLLLVAAAEIKADEEAEHEMLDWFAKVAGISWVKRALKWMNKMMEEDGNLSINEDEPSNILQTANEIDGEDIDENVEDGDKDNNDKGDEGDEGDGTTQGDIQVEETGGEQNLESSEGQSHLGFNAWRDGPEQLSEDGSDDSNNLPSAR
jgi:hypothetical protein